MKTILAVITDLLDSEKFIKYNVNLAEDMKFNLHLVYVQNPALYTLSTGTAASSSQPMDNEVDTVRLETERKNALKSVKEQVNKFQNDLPESISIEVSVDAGTVTMILNQYISDNKAEMAVLKGQDENDFWLADSTNIRVIQKINCPGWIIPSECNYQPFKKIIYATDYNEADIQTLKKLAALTKRSSPQITALHITESGNFKEKAMESGFREMLIKNSDYDRISVESIIDEKKGDDIGKLINEYAIDNEADLLVLLKENQGFIDKIFKPGTTRKVTREALKKAGIPVLVFKE